MAVSIEELEELALELKREDPGMALTIAERIDAWLLRRELEAEQGAEYAAACAADFMADHWWAELEEAAAGGDGQ